MRATSAEISDDTLLQKAKELAESSGVEGFKGTNGWLSGFKHRHDVRSANVHDESADADEAGVELAQRSMPALLTSQGFRPEDVWETDKAEPRRTLLRGAAGLPSRPASTCASRAPAVLLHVSLVCPSPANTLSPLPCVQVTASRCAAPSCPRSASRWACCATPQAPTWSR
jgi:hypothetical protein